MHYEDGFFTALDEFGNEVELEVLFTVESEKTGKDIIVYTDNTYDEQNNTRIYMSYYDPTKAEVELIPIEEDSEDWDFIDNLLKEIMDNVNSLK